MKFRDLATTALAIGVLAAGPAIAQTQSQGSMANQGSTKSQASQAPISQSTVKHLQQTLEQRGLYQGQVDGIYGPATKAAVQKFQQENNLQATGKLNVRTLSELGVIGHEQTAARTAPGQNGSMNSAENGANAGSQAMTGGHQQATAGQNGAENGSQGAAGQQGSMNTAENNTHGAQTPAQGATPGASSQHSTAAIGAANSGTGTTEATGSGH